MSPREGFETLNVWPDTARVIRRLALSEQERNGRRTSIAELIDRAVKFYSKALIISEPSEPSR